MERIHSRKTALKVALALAVPSAISGCGITREGAAYDAAATEQAPYFDQSAVVDTTAVTDLSSMSRSSVDAAGYEPWSCWSKEVEGTGYVDANGNHKRDDEEKWQVRVWPADDMTKYPDGKKLVLWAKGDYGKHHAENIKVCKDACHKNDLGKDDWCEQTPDGTAIPTATATSAPTAGPSATATATGTPKPTDAATATATRTSQATEAASATPKVESTATATVKISTPDATPTRKAITVQLYPRDAAWHGAKNGVFAMNGPIPRLDGWEHTEDPFATIGDVQDGVEYGPSLAEGLSIHIGQINGVGAFEHIPLACTNNEFADLDTAVRAVTGRSAAQLLGELNIVGNVCIRVEGAPEDPNKPVTVQIHPLTGPWLGSNGVFAVNGLIPRLDGWEHVEDPFATPGDVQDGVDLGASLAEGLSIHVGQINAVAAFQQAVQACTNNEFADLDTAVRAVTGLSAAELLDYLDVVGDVCIRVEGVNQ